MDTDAGGYPYPSEAGGHHAVAVILLLLILFAIASASGWGGHGLAGRNHQQRRAAARKAIYKTIRRALDKALKARDAELLIAARDLMRVTSQRLGPLVDAGRPVFSAIESVNKALAGKITDKPKPPESPLAEAKPAAKDAGGTVVFTPSVNINLGGAHRPEPPDRPAERDMTVPEQLTELAKAVNAFDRTWREDKVEAFLAAAQDALLDASDGDDRARDADP